MQYTDMICFQFSYNFNHIKKYKITPCASATAIGGTICSDIVRYSASRGIGGVTGGNFIFSTELVGILLEKKMYNQLRIYKFYEWKQCK